MRGLVVEALVPIQATPYSFRPPMALHFQEDEETGERDSPDLTETESLSTPAAEAAETGNLHDELAEIFKNEKHSPGYEHIEHVQRQLAGQSCSSRHWMRIRRDNIQDITGRVSATCAQNTPLANARLQESVE